LRRGWPGPSGCASRFRSTATRGRSSGNPHAYSASEPDSITSPSGRGRKRGSRAAVFSVVQHQDRCQRDGRQLDERHREGESRPRAAPGRSRSTRSPMTRPRLRAPRLNSPSARPPMGSCTRPSRTFQQKPWWARRRQPLHPVHRLHQWDASAAARATVLWNCSCVTRPSLRRAATNRARSPIATPVGRSGTVVLSNASGSFAIEFSTRQPLDVDARRDRLLFGRCPSAAPRYSTRGASSPSATRGGRRQRGARRERRSMPTDVTVRFGVGGARFLNITGTSAGRSTSACLRAT